MSCCVLKEFNLISATADDLPLVNNNSPHGDFLGIKGHPSFLKGFDHEPFIIVCQFQARRKLLLMFTTHAATLSKP
jgi:hypothetical protein